MRMTVAAVLMELRRIEEAKERYEEAVEDHAYGTAATLQLAKVWRKREAERRR